MRVRSREKRHSCRKKVSLGAKLSSNGKSSAGFINNLSKNGVFVRTTSMVSNTNFNHGKVFDLKFQTFSGKTLSLQCKVQWSCKTPPLGLTDCVGMEIIDPPLEYSEFLKTLQ